MLLLVILLWFIHIFTVLRPETTTLEDGTEITTYYSRFGYTPKERYVKYADGPYIRASGDLTESGKLHGCWWYEKRRCDPPWDKFDKIWYWYGEECTEGDFVKWNK
ncbi:MAG: hypothetical protein JXA11_01575 [Phycisphaerae bacterium]|nr:hypothetical protein [Phycisphaerae bacterium]